MESVEQFEKSFKELGKIKKSIGSDKVVIDFKELDGATALLLREAITPIVVKRTQDIQPMILGVK